MFVKRLHHVQFAPLQSLSIILSQHWIPFMNQFYEVIASNSDNESINRFLILWKKLLEKLLENDMFSTFLNEKHVVAFFQNAYKLSTISLQIYVDVIIQLFTSSSKVSLNEKRGNKYLEEAVSSALDSDFLNKLPSDVQISGFCVLTKFSKRESLTDTISQCSSGLDPVIVKKISFIFSYALLGTRDRDLLCNAVEKVLLFIKCNFNILPEVLFHECVLDVFMDQDDILLGMMLAFLRIYITLKDCGGAENTRPPNCDKLQSDLNPHGFFIAFLQKIGFDHNELLSFLTSDETSFLMYLLQYLKLLLQEWSIFVETHQTIIKSCSNVYQSGVVKEFCKHSSGCTPKISLVTYSSSSSSDEESNSLTIAADKSYSSSDDLIVIQTLIKLKLAIQKLSDLNEFPYNAAPLITLIAACQRHSLIL